MLSSGSRLGPYEILAPPGAGGMGEVYRARDTRLERTVAIKVLASHIAASPEVRQRFEREARTISQLSHPHICALHDVGREGERACPAWRSSRTGRRSSRRSSAVTSGSGASFAVVS